MSFLGGIVKSVGGAILGGVTGGITSRVSSKVNPSRRTSRRDVRMGHEEDTRSFKERAEYSWDKAKERGLTPQEFYGSPAAGGSGSSGGAQVLGNSLDKQQATYQQIGQESKENQLNRQTQLAQTKMQTDAQIETAKISAGATTGAAETSAKASKYAADINAAIAANKLKLDTKSYNNIALPAAAANLKISEQQLNKLLNEVTTSTPAWKRWDKMMSMGVDNVLASSLAMRHGIELKKESLQKLSESQWKSFLSQVLAVQSNVAKEFAGATSNVHQGLDTGASILGSGVDAVRNLFNSGIEKTQVLKGPRAVKR